jgi:hypothetical protein
VLIPMLLAWFDGRRWRRSTALAAPPNRAARLAILASWINADEPSIEAAFAVIALATELADLIHDTQT